jgi:O-antigen ligase
MLLLATVDVLRRIHGSSITLLGVLTLAVAGFCLLMLPPLWSSSLRGQGGRGGQRILQPVSGDAHAVPAALWLFCLWAVLRMATSSFDAAAVQNVGVYIAFIGTIAVTSGRSSDGTPGLLLAGYRRAAWIAACGYAVSVVVFGFDSGQIFSPRSFALSALVMIAATIPTAEDRRYGPWLPALLFLLVTASLSRTATVVAAFMLIALAVRASRGVRLRRTVVLSSGLVIALVWMINSWAPVRERFESAGDNTSVAGITLNSSGRARVWSVTLQSAKEDIWFGHGPGSANRLISQVFGSGIGHPHNDYLRLLHDYGIVGVALWGVGYLVLLFRVLKRARLAPDRSSERIHIAASLALTAIALGMITDNVVAYLFVMVPLGALVGASLAHPAGYAPAKSPYADDPTMATEALGSVRPDRQSWVFEETGTRR